MTFKTSHAVPYLILIGAGGFGLEVAAYAEDAHRADPRNPVVKGFLDDTKPIGAIHAGYPVLGDTNAPIDRDALYLIALGFPDSRRKIDQRFKAQGACFHTLIHPQSYVAASAQVGEGGIVTPFAVVGPETRLGRHCLMNHFSSIGHEASVGDYGVLCPHASVHGAARLGDDVFMGSGAYVTARIAIGNRVKVSAGSVVYGDVPDDTLAIGNPAAFRADRDKAGCADRGGAMLQKTVKGERS